MILVLDFGSQYTQLIARRIRSLNVSATIVPFSIPAREIRRHKPNGIILSGGPASVKDSQSPLPDTEILQLGVPILGICYGLQVLANLQGGEIIKAHKREYGKATLSLTGGQSEIFDGLPDKFTVWMSHGDKVVKLPTGARVLGNTHNSEFCAVGNQNNRWFGLQFHPEVRHTEFGTEILKNFVKKVCKAPQDWHIGDLIEKKVAEIRRLVGDAGVLCAVSGGVDSTVLATLLHRAVGERLRCVLVDNGLLREREAETVAQRLKKFANISPDVVDMREKFLNALEGITNPETKRKIIGRLFIETFLSMLGEGDFLAQGTLYPDVIESVNVRGPSDTIKTHHNRVPEVLALMKKGRVLEPLKELFKDEVRELGRKLGLPDDIINRQPFPGPGLAIRILGEVTEDALAILRRADAIIIEESKKAGLYDELWQIFGVLLPIRSVGVMGDSRSYSQVLAVRAVTSRDAMTAHWARLPYDFLETLSNRIVNEVKGINRIVYDITSKPPGTIEWE